MGDQPSQPCLEGLRQGPGEENPSRGTLDQLYTLLTVPEGSWDWFAQPVIFVAPVPRSIP